MEGYAVRHQAQVAGEDQQVHGHVGLAAELARQRPVGGGRAFGEDAYVDFRARCGLGDVAQVGFGVGGVQAHALLVEVADVLGFLDGVAVADAIRADALVQHFIQLVDRGDVEARAFLVQQVDDFDGRVGLDGVVDLGEFETCTQVIVGLGDHLGIDDHERGFLLVGERLHFLKGIAREIVFDLDRHAGGLLVANVSYQWVQMNVLRIPTLVRLLPKACRRKQKGHGINRFPWPCCLVVST